MSEFIHLFPLSVFRDSIRLSQSYKQTLVDAILQMEKENQKQQSDAAWLGDTQGHEFLFQDERFAQLFQEIGNKVRNYTTALGVDTERISFYFQRAWATVTRSDEIIHEHAHHQSNISFSYYLKKPTGSGGINFITYQHPNEFSPGIFTPTKSELGFIKEQNMLTWNLVNIDPAEDEILVFPSKTLHSTSENATDEPRISISADITTMLTDSSGHETMMPHFSHWKEV